MSFHDAEIRRDEEGRVRRIRHVRTPYGGDAAARQTPQKLADHYLREAAELLDFGRSVLASPSESPQDPPREILPDEDSRLRLRDEKRSGESRVLSYAQTYLGLPVWRAGVTVVMQSSPLRVTSSNNTFHYGLQVEPPGEDAPFVADEPKKIEKLVRDLAGGADADLVDLDRGRLALHVYRYDPGRRQKGGGQHGDDLPTLPLDEEPEEIEPGAHRVVTEMLFSLAVGPWPRLPWRALVDARTGAVLYLEPGVEGVDGQVFRFDPVLTSSDDSITPCSDLSELNPLRESVELPGLDAPDPGDDQELAGEYVELGEQASPSIDPPTESPGDDFSYDADSDDFSAVNAYFHCDAAFRLLEDLGFSVGAYMGGTSFPVTVDHRDSSLGTVNARAYANSSFDGSGGFGFNLAQSGCPVGIAADSRVAWHEVCHGLLLDHVDSFNFGFAHSAGDALGVILSDPDTDAPDRFETFPFNDIGRRHDRSVGAGWAWGGSQDDGGYGSESILATTLFRLYRSIGGDSGHAPHRRLAARHAAFLIIGAIGTLTPANDAATADDYATALMDFDRANDFDGVSRGALHKVVRWAFEEQGLYQPAGAPTPVTTTGDPPDVDVYIDDGRDGTYEYRRNFWNSPGVWNRTDSDGGTAHQTPILDQTNYLYVRVRNRGTETATGVSVKAYHCRPSTGLVWPDDWQAAATAELSGPDVAPGGEEVVGPFEWTPEVEGHECLLAIASADGDPGNDATVTGTIAHGRFVPFDNNIAQLNVAPVPGGGGARALAAAFDGRAFWFNNPLARTIRARVEVELPSFLRERGWRLDLLNPGGDRFTLGPRADRRVTMRLRPGEGFTAADVRQALGSPAIEITSLADGRVVGGMSYPVDPEMTEPAAERAPRRDGDRCERAAGELLDCLGWPSDQVCDASVRRVTIEVDLGREDC